MTRCTKCGGNVFLDPEDGFKCLQCGRYERPTDLLRLVQERNKNINLNKQQRYVPGSRLGLRRIYQGK